MEENCGTLWFGPISLDKRASFGISTWKQMCWLRLKEEHRGFKMVAHYGGMLGNFVEAAIDFGWVCVE